MYEVIFSLQSVQQQQQQQTPYRKTAWPQLLEVPNAELVIWGSTICDHKAAQQ